MKRMAGGAGKGVYDDDEKICSRFESIYVKEIKAQPKEDADIMTMEISFDQLYGKKQYFRVDLPEKREGHIRYDMRIEERKLKLLLIHGDQELQVLAEIEADDTVDVSFDKGEYIG